MYTNVCPAGAYCVSESTTPDIGQCSCLFSDSSCPGYCCTAGYYCNAGTKEEYECPIGFYRDT